MPKETWYARTTRKIERSELSESDIIAVRRKLRNVLNDENSPDHDKAIDVLAAVIKHMPRVSDAQAAKGKAWLHARVFRADGKVRDTPETLQFTLDDLNILRACTGFNLVELVEEYNTHGDWLCGLYPIYRCLSPYGWFDYIAYPWQAGRQLEITARGN